MPRASRILILASLLCSASAQGAPLRLGRDFSPNPMFVPVQGAISRDVTIDKLGFSGCRIPGVYEGATPGPVVSWQFAAEMKDLTIALEHPLDYPVGGAGVIRLADTQQVQCLGIKGRVTRTWPAGRYELYLFGANAQPDVRLRFENRGGARQTVERAATAATAITLGSTNPQFLLTPVGPSAEAQDLGVGGCVKAGMRVTAIGRLEVTKASTFHVEAPGASVFALDGGSCIDLDDREGGPLSAGTHTLWTAVPREKPPATWQLEVDDRGRSLAFAAAPRHAVGALDKPLLLSGTVRPEERWPSRSRCDGAARDPDFYLSSKEPLQDVLFELLGTQRELQEMHMFGPLEQTDASSQVTCHRAGSHHSFDGSVDLFEGTYALWVGSQRGDRGTGTDFHLVVRRKKVPLDPMAMPVPIPAQLDLAGRSVDIHYPFLGSGGDAFFPRLFLAAPDQLFVHARVQLGRESKPILKGEPLLVLWSNGASTKVIRFDGRTEQVDTRLLALERPATVALPTRAVPLEASSVSEAIRLAGPEDRKAIDAYSKRDEKMNACLDRFYDRQGDDGVVLRVKRNGDVVDVNKERDARAERACNYDAFEDAGDDLVKRLAGTRGKRAAAHLAAVRKRFGL